MADIDVLNGTEEDGKELRYNIAEETMEDIRNNKPISEEKLERMCTESKYRNWINMRYQFLKDNAEEFKLDEMRKDATLTKELFTCNMICKAYYKRYLFMYKDKLEKGQKIVSADESMSNYYISSQYAIETVYQEFICSPDVYYIEFDNWANMTEEEYLKIEDEY